MCDRARRDYTCTHMAHAVPQDAHGAYERQNFVQCVCSWKCFDTSQPRKVLLAKPFGPVFCRCDWGPPTMLRQAVARGCSSSPTTSPQKSSGSSAGSSDVSPSKSAVGSPDAKSDEGANVEARSPTAPGCGAKKRPRSGSCLTALASLRGGQDMEAVTLTCSSGGSSLDADHANDCLSKFKTVPRLIGIVLEPVGTRRAIMEKVRASWDNSFIRGARAIMSSLVQGSHT